ncbi:DUF2079 domain-containing protein [Actinomarinicola tropica]|uniref:DUF2079 domain-containing protein n=1 Tax=Actinomarinicola tropica TaxID=2789776 RepID=A0A5Q2RL05_9ACTN|nr:DUF2079 domain-containing protein [Actinomarinicola tropica]QGG95251.1 DUF2079 domain-containing protein [Actinomarinicola tropica]
MTATVTRSFRRRIDYQLLRWQARLDGAWADRVIPLVAMLGLFVVLAGTALARARSFETGSELGTWVQGAWQITTSRPAESTITGRHLLEPQLAVGFYGVAQLTRLVAAIPLLLALQSAALAAGAGAIWRLARQVCTLRVGAALAAVVAYGVHPTLHTLNLADVHPEAFALPALLWGAYATYRGRWAWALPLFLLAVSMRSDLGLAVAAIGGGLVVGGRARGGRRLVVAGFAWTALAQLVVQPMIGGDGFVHQDAFARYGDDGPGILWGMVTAPWEVIGDLIAHENLEVLVALLAPVAFLSTLAPRRLLPFAPVLAIPFVADVPIAGPEGVGHLVAPLAGVFIALPFALENLGRRNIERVTVDRRILAALTLAALTFFVLDAPSSPYSEPWAWGGRDAADGVRLEIVERLDRDERVRAAPSLVGELAARDVIRAVPTGVAPTASELTSGVDVVVLDEEVVATWDLGEDEVAELVEELEAQGFEEVAAVEGIRVHRRRGT